MRTDRELLGLAANAAGVDGTWHEIYGTEVGQDACGISAVAAPRWGDKLWNPLTDDGDNRRLQVKLRLGLVPLEGGGWDCIAWDYDGEVSLATDFDPNRVIVRAAADIAVRTHPDHKDGGANE
ncbi:hypothetical protein RA224_12810 [Achromobacter aegrifaciens]|uniref:hypothetical protein n=1 Tax=Achromobacter aegrifaciens TaxID=1287736 RepID=UPI0027BA986E|nr:hypothetical protein [Achromobacter aegrifaciens]WLW64265.1 hypothetical protein RA224_12810 [Achromobacter aegrifaciens]